MSASEAVAAAEGHPVLLFDGVCNLCNGTVQWLIEHDPEAVFRFAPLQSDVATEVTAGCPDVDTDALDGFVLVDPAGSCYEKSTAVLRAARYLDGPWSTAAGLLLYVPRPLRELGYWIVARSRYRVFGKRESCMAPTPDVADRFLVEPRTGGD